MRRNFLLLTLSLTTMVPGALAQQLNTPAPPITPTAETTESARVAIQSATNQLNAALLRGDAQEVLKWLAPNFELGQRQYRVRDLAWMKRALPVQLKRGRYTKLLAKVREVELKGGVARTGERVDAELALNPKVAPEEHLQQTGTEGSENSEWVETQQGWRLQRANDALEQLLFLAAPPAPLRKQPPASPTSSVAAAGMTLQEPELVLERRVGQLERALAFSPDARQFSFNYDWEHVHFVSPQKNASLRTSIASINTLIYTRNGRLWTTDSLGKLYRWNASATAIEQEWTVAQQYSYHKVSVAPNGSAFAVAEGNELRLWNPTQKQPIVTLPLATGVPYKMEHSPDGDSLALTSAQGVEVRNAQDGTLLREVKDQKWGGFLSDGETMVTMKLGDNALHRYPKGEGDILFFRSVATGEVVREVSVPALWSQEQEQLRERMDAGQSVSVPGFTTLPDPVLSPDGTLAASTYYDGQIGIWNTRTGQIVRILRGFSDVNAPELVFSLDGRQLAVSSQAGEIALWDVSLPTP